MHTCTASESHQSVPGQFSTVVVPNGGTVGCVCLNFVNFGVHHGPCGDGENQAEALQDQRVRTTTFLKIND